MYPKAEFLELLADLIVHKHAGNFNKLRVIVPNKHVGYMLYKNIVAKCGTCILPKIVPLIQLMDEVEMTQATWQQVQTMDRIEEKVMLASIINEYSLIQYDQSQALRIAPSLANVFALLQVGEVEMQDLKDLSQLDQSEHWYKIYNFLVFAFERWQNATSNLNMITRAMQQKLICELEIQRLRDQSQNLIIAAIMEDSLVTTNFLHKARALSNCEIVLPPYASTKHNIQHDTNFDSSNKRRYALLNDLIAGSSSAIKATNISYIEFDNIFHEAQYIAVQCMNVLAANPDYQIAILVHTQASKNQYCQFLDKYKIKYHDMVGQGVLDIAATSLLLILLELKYSDFCLKNFFALLSHPLLNQSSTTPCLLKNLIRKHNRFSQDWQNIRDIVHMSQDVHMIQYFTQIHDAFAVQAVSTSLVHIVQDAMQMMQKIVPNVWDHNQELAAALDEICMFKVSLSIKEPKECAEILRQILAGISFATDNNHAQVIITSPSLTMLSNYDLVIITDANEENYPNITDFDAWLSEKILEMFNLQTQKQRFARQLYEFYLNLCNSKVILTRAKKDLKNKKTTASPFILNLHNLLQGRMQTKEGKLVTNITDDKMLRRELVKLGHFPTEIYATDIETLLKSPYNFYAKKILKLRKCNEISDSPSLADFGQFVHLVIETYTNKYTLYSDKHIAFLEIVKSRLDEIRIPIAIQKLWYTKLSVLADEFIAFDESRRKDSKAIYCEIEGKLSLNINQNHIQVKAIADRIEITKSGKAIILDFKTGTLPTMKDVLSGMAPQLVIEALILQENGFGIDCVKLGGLVYVKIGSCAPYLSIREILLTDDELRAHRDGLVKLLSHYIQKGEFAIETCLMQYDDYQHLARRE